MPDLNPSPTPAEREQDADGVILAWLTDIDAQRPWSIEEIIREYGEPNNAADALSRLHGVGLIHRHGDFVWATRAAMRAEAISM
jgi:predicted transcriptional regulator